MSTQPSLAGVAGDDPHGLLNETISDRVSNEWQKRGRYSQPWRVGPDYPALYHPETPQDERMRIKGELGQTTVSGSGQTQTTTTGPAPVMRVMPIGEEEIAYYQQWRQQMEQAEFDNWVSDKFDPKQPGQLRWLMSIYPEYVQRRVEQLKNDLELEQWDRMLKAFGVDSREDLYMQHLIDKKKVDMRNNYLEKYQAGMFSGLMKMPDKLHEMVGTPGTQFAKFSDENAMKKHLRSLAMGETNQPIVGETGTDYRQQKLGAKSITR